MSDKCKMPNCELVNMEHVLKNSFEPQKQVHDIKQPCNINKAMAILDEITLDILQKEIATTSPDDPFHKAYKDVIPDIQERIERRRRRILPSFNGQIAQGPVNVLNNRNH